VLSSAGLDLAPLVSTVTRTTSRFGSGFSCSGGLRPRWSRMRLIDNSSAMQATILRGPPQPLQTSGSAAIPPDEARPIHSSAPDDELLERERIPDDVTRHVLRKRGSLSSADRALHSAVPLLDQRAIRRDSGRRMRPLTLAELWQNYLSPSRKSAMYLDRAWS
jgi:hypothetical protein